MDPLTAIADHSALRELERYPHKRSLKEIHSLHRKVTFCKVDEVERKLESKYEASPAKFFFKICDIGEKRNLLTLIVKKVDAERCLKIIARNTIEGAAVGAIAGGIVGACVALGSQNPGYIITGMTKGVQIIGGAEFIRSSYHVFRHCLEWAPIIISKSPQFEMWKSGLDKEKYDLFVNIIKNYDLAHCTREIELKECPISCDIPEHPVISPNGHVFEKAFIEKWLDEKWLEVERARDSGYSGAILEPFLSRICPLRSKPFKKEELRYVEKVYNEARELIAFRDYTIPEIPVSGPDGRVYEKEMIEKLLDTRWEAIEAFKAAGCTAEELQKKTLEVFGGESFKKEDLVYDCTFAKQMIKQLKSIKNRVSLDPTVKPENDAFLKKVLNTVLEHYKRTYKEVKQSLVIQLGRDLLEVGATQEQHESILKNYVEYWKNPNS